MQILFICILLLSLTLPSFQKTKEEWKSRTIYQLITDRFAKGDGSKGSCDLHKYCGGNFQGVIKNLDYIQSCTYTLFLEMGFDAIWISPVIDNYDNGYHGYYGRNIYEVNSHFGTKNDLTALVNECHNRGIWVMVDVVANHMGNTDQDYSQNAPFTDKSHYHSYCNIQNEDWGNRNMQSIQNCRLSGLADLNSENTFVQQELFKWITWLIKEFKFDGIRVDTIIEVPNSFWYDFTKAAGVYSVGEVFDHDPSFVAKYVGPIDSVLNYPQYFALRDILLHSKDMTEVKNFYAQWSGQVGAGNLPFLGNFNDNQDNPRFLSGSVNTYSKYLNVSNQNQLNQEATQRFLEEHQIKGYDESKYKQYKAFTAFQLTSIGIPIIFYGTEQAFQGGNDPENREILWNNLNQDHDMYKFIQTINKARKATNAAAQPQIERYVDAEIYAFSRGTLLAVFSSKQDRVVNKNITFHPYSEGQTICNALYISDCVKIAGGVLSVTINYGEVKIFTPQ